MPGYTIHIAIAKKYIEKHKSEIKNEEEFINGAIAPDMNYIDQFLNDIKVNMNQDYWKGYFCHLLSDHYFYNKYFKEEHQEIIKSNDRFYYDYDCLNKELIQKYKIKLTNNIIKQINFYNDKPKYLKISKVEEFIENISDMSIQEKVEIIKQKGMEGLK